MMGQEHGMANFDRISWNPKQRNGQPSIRGMRLTVKRVVAAVAAYPDLEEQNVRQALELAAANLGDDSVEIRAA